MNRVAVILAATRLELLPRRVDGCRRQRRRPPHQACPHRWRCGAAHDTAGAEAQRPFIFLPREHRQGLAPLHARR